MDGAKDGLACSDEFAEEGDDEEAGLAVQTRSRLVGEKQGTAKISMNRNNVQRLTAC